MTLILKKKKQFYHTRILGLILFKFKNSKTKNKKYKYYQFIKSI